MLDQPRQQATLIAAHRCKTGHERFIGQMGQRHTRLIALRFSSPGAPRGAAIGTSDAPNLVRIALVAQRGEYAQQRPSQDRDRRREQAAAQILSIEIVTRLVF
jgi:hypothetical protein